MDNYVIPGAIVAFSIKGKTVWSESFGLSDIENNVPTHVDSPWRLCSISKTVTSALVGQLIDKKLLDLDKPINDYLPISLFPIHRYNGTEYKLTLRLLMSHMAGLHVTALPDDFGSFFKATNVTQMISLFNNEPLLYKPGTKWDYSNYGIQVVGAIIESILKTNFVDEMSKLFAKIGMNSTVIEKHENLLKHRPRYYSASPDKPTVLQTSDLIDDMFNYEGWWPAGGILSTVTDMLRFGNTMVDAYHGTDQSIVSQSTIKELWKPETVGKIKPELHKDYAKQWVVYNMNSCYPYKLAVGHSGGLLGTSTQLTLFPNEHIVGTIFTNKGSLLVLPDYIAQVAGNGQLENFEQQICVQKWQHFDDNKNYTKIDDVISDARKELRALINNYVIPGAVVAFSIKGKTVWSESFGLSDIENNVSTHVDSPWRLCSISKPVTSALVGQLLDKKLLDLDKHIDNYLPLSLFPIHRYKDIDYNLTLRLLMSHKAGLHVTAIPDDFHRFFKATNVTQTIKQFNNEPLIFKPGTGWLYSNYGIQVVGAIVESVLNSNFVDEMPKLFAKIGMNLTSLEKHENLVKHRPRYYSALPDKPTVLQNSDLIDDLFNYEGWWPAGGVLSTVGDMLRFGNAMIDAYHGTDQSIVSQSTIKELWKPETIGIYIPPIYNADYGKQWMIYHTNASYPYKLVVGHGGSLLGTSTQLTLFPNEHIVGTVFTNKGGIIILPDFIAKVAEKFKNFI
ncbi:uncharacterized protein LOC128956705 [Oppia nitens]|uniref:uncharacterized protein LOC128956705 n=1 Tax=Oppia nitens TaxID=1686743 RepID=UPI0023D9E41A|nr:uncharacterized protein LOC128956705 [Oppia nitens]